jgi:hypothetical protein
VNLVLNVTVVNTNCSVAGIKRFFGSRSKWSGSVPVGVAKVCALRPPSHTLRMMPKFAVGGVIASYEEAMNRSPAGEIWQLEAARRET